MTVTIRSATSDDIPAIQAVGVSAWRDTYTGLVPDGYITVGLEQFWSRESFERALASHDTRLLVAERDGQIIGMIRLTVTGDGVAHLGQLYLRHTARGQGLGKTLWAAATANLSAHVRSFRTSVIEGSPALRFYQRLGFTVTHHERPSLRGYTVPLMMLEMPARGGDLTAVDYVASELAYNAFMTPAYREAIATLGLPPGSCGLDLGCGPGGLLPLLDAATAQRGQIVGVDISRPHLAAAQQLIAAQGLEARARLEWVDLREPLPFADASFDWAWCADVLWAGCGLTPLAVVREAARVVRPGGTVAIWFIAPERGIVLPGEPQLEHALRAAYEEPRAPAASSPVHHETAVTWLRAAGLADRRVYAHLAEARFPIEPAAHAYLEGYLLSGLRGVPRAAVSPAVEDAVWARWRRLSDPNGPGYVLAQPDYHCVQVGLLAVGRVL
ncbi:MAG: GNAT family N-acetyltransferase [Chloroflexales bacterium]|nr:GNAT family N-acetyltransferase [Chloroflexales bacterium]